jgi:homoserine/homoserine lactone efflux protein
MSHGLELAPHRRPPSGLEIALVVILIIAGAGVGSLLVASETAFNVIKLPVPYLIYLGFSQWRARVPSSRRAKPWMRPMPMPSPIVVRAGGSVA